MQNKINKKRGFTCTPKFGVIPKGDGFTIIETMISISLFIIIVMAGMNSLLNADLIHGKSKDMRSIMDNLSFIMDDISKNLRTGYNYRCITVPGDLSNPDTLAQPQDGASCGGISFEWQNGTPLEYNAYPLTSIKNYNGGDQWVYNIDSTNGFDFNIRKSIDGGTSWTQLNPDEVKLKSISGFSVFGAESGDNQQPFVVIKLVGKVNLKGVETPFSLQTSVSQRARDL